VPPAREIDLEQVVHDFEGWLRLRVPGATIEQAELPPTGASNGTYLCAVRVPDGHLEVVLRLQPVENQFLDPDVLFQSRVMRAIAAHTRVPVPHVLWEEPDPRALGTPFVVMQRVDGAVLSDSHHTDGWALQLRPEQRAAMYKAVVDAFVTLHTTPLVEQLHFLRRPGVGTATQRHMQWLQRWRDWAAAGRRLGLIDDGLAYVLAHCPDDDAEVVLWGDARPGNMLFGPDLSVAAVLDWELAATGPPEIDLGWWLMFEDSQTVARGASRPDGVPSAAAIVAQYEAGIGRPVRNLAYWQAVGALEFAIIVRRYCDMQIAAGRMPRDSTLADEAPAMRLLAHAIGATAPAEL
jgi:aminoglycoside phosphotransferase (APT) family kinase protein